MVNVVDHTRLAHGHDRFTAADYREGGTRGQCLGHRQGAGSKIRYLEDTHRTVPEDGAGSGKDFPVARTCLGPDVHNHQLGGDGVACHHLYPLWIVNRVGNHDVVRQDEFDATFGCGSEHRSCCLDHLLLDQRPADLESLCEEECVGHATADEK